MKNIAQCGLEMRLLLRDEFGYCIFYKLWNFTVLKDAFIATSIIACDIFQIFGEGDVDWDNYLKALKEIGYDGFLTIERECGEDPVSDIIKATSFLREKMF